MTPEDARTIQASSETVIPQAVIDILTYVDDGISQAAGLGRNTLDLTGLIPSYGGNVRSAWFRAMDELRKKGFIVKSNYLGKAYAINGNYYSYYVCW